MVDKFLQTGTGYNGLNIPNAVQQKIAPVGIQLGEHIVQKQHGGVSGDLFYQFYLRQFQGKSRSPLLSLGPILSDIHLPCGESEIISVGPNRCHLCLNIPLLVLRKLPFKVLHPHMGLVENFQLLPASGEFSVDAVDNLIELIHKKLSALNDLCSKIHQLHVPYAQGGS